MNVECGDMLAEILSVEKQLNHKEETVVEDSGGR